MRRLSNRRGMVLIFALWVVGILTILAVSVAAGIRQKIFLVQRLDERSRMNNLLHSAVKKAAGYIHQEMEVSDFEFTPDVKMHLLNNTGELTNIMLKNDRAAIGYIPVSQDDKSMHWGVVDEESKINLNKTDNITLTNLLTNVLKMKDEDASKLALSLLDWRQEGTSEITGFYGDDYYSNLDHPYPKKSADYECLDEILLVKGMTKEIYDKLVNYVTIYGDGAVNINTAPEEVLEAMGITEELADKILMVRRGKDGIDGTADDRIFSKTYEITAVIANVVPINLLEARQIDILNMRGLLTTDSFYYSITAAGKLSSRSTAQSVHAIYSARDDKIVYWNER